MSDYILSVAGIILLGVLINIILPEGNMNKFIQNIFALIVVFVIISPVTTLVKQDNFSTLFTKDVIEVDANYIKTVNYQTVYFLENQIELALEEEGFKGVFVTILANLELSPISFEKVELDLKNLVMNEKNKHINKYSKMKEVVLENIEIEEEKVVFYG